MLIIPYLVCASKSGTEIVHLLQMAYTRYSVLSALAIWRKRWKRIIFFIILEISIKNVFVRKEFPHIGRMTEEQYLLKNVVQAVADKLYVETKFLSEVKEKEETKWKNI